MTPRDRVARALRHEETDRVPVDFGGTVVTGMDYQAHENLKRLLGITGLVDPIIDYTMGTVEPCEQIKQLAGADFRRVGMNTIVPSTLARGAYEDGFGIHLRRADPHRYFDVARSPLADAVVEDLVRMKMPDPENPSLYYGLKDKAHDLFDNSPYALVADFGVPGFYETSQKLRGYENLACDLLVNQEFVTSLYDRLLDLQKRFFRKYLGEVGKYVHVVGYADDLGMQDRPQMSPEVYRRVIKPYHKAIFRFIHEQADVRILLHSCGAISPLIEDLIDAGVDILNPVQTRAAGMDPLKLNTAFGGRLVFWGGVDVQRVIPRGSRTEIFEAVEHITRALSAKGGFVLAPAHNIQEDTPAANVVNMFDAFRMHRTRRDAA